MSAWFPNVKFNRRARVRLFCFPYAGGSAQMYRHWQGSLPADIEVCPVQLPGRDSRLKEQGFTNMQELAQELTRLLRPHLDRPFALFGHSMGGIIVFELARELRRASGLQPVHLFIAGRTAPQLRDEIEMTYDLPEEKLIEKVRDIKGTPDEVLAHPELMRMVLPLLRADFELVETYTYVAEQPLSCPITVLGGLEDEDVPREKLEGWREHSTAAFSLRMFPGGHFFIKTAQAYIHRTLAQELLPHVR